MIIVPNYYKDFHCTASECRHSCCKGWEIDIDEDSHRRYGEVTGAFGEKLRRSIYIDEGGAHFALDEEERCPFLREDGLCEMIITIGEEQLCNICADHPRFRNYLPGITEIGLGICCEAAAKLILTNEKTFALCREGDDTTELPELLKEREVLLSILTDRTKSMKARLLEYCAHLGIELYDDVLAEWLELYSGLEIMDSAWSEKLNCPKAAPLRPDTDSAELELAFEQLAVYFLFRHYAGAYDDGREFERTVFAVHAVSFIRELLYACGDVSLDALLELARLYSAEIEYSDENLDIIFDELSLL